MSESIAVLIPCYNEAVTIAKVVDDFKRELPEAAIYVYDNNSKDDTAKIAAEHGAIVRREPRQGKGNVVRSMFRDIDADYYIMVDGDDTYPAEAARDLIAPLTAGEADMTVGDRLSNGSYGEENDRAFHGFGNDLVRWLIKAIYGFAFDDVMTGYRAFNRAFVKTMPVLPRASRSKPSSPSMRSTSAGALSTCPSSTATAPRAATEAVDLRRRREGAQGHRKPVQGIQAARLLRLDLAHPVALGLIVGIPVITAFVATGVVLRIPSTVLAVGLVFCGCLSMTAGLILDSVAKANRKQWELEVYKFMSKDNE